MRKTVKLIREWAVARNLVEGSKPKDQTVKLGEEFGELCAAIARGKSNDVIADALGDMFVVMTIVAAQHGMEIEDCVDKAYSVIKDRKGKMVDGVFVRDCE